MSRKLTMLIGIPGSGKSTLRESIKDENTMVLSFDDIKEELFAPGGPYEDIGYENNGDYEKSGWKHPELIEKRRNELIKEIKESDKNLIIDTTALTPKKRAQYFKWFKGCFDEIDAVFVNTSLAKSLERNMARDRIVPQDVIVRMATDLILPSKKESFNQVYEYDTDTKTMQKFNDPSKKIVYVDMDGVVADFNAGCKKNGVVPPKDKKLMGEFWERLSQEDHFYKSLPPIEEGIKMVKGLIQKGYDVKFLTGVPRSGKIGKEAALDKVEWAKEIFGDKVEVIPTYKVNKPMYCVGKNTILIDDTKKNVEAWREAGGTALHFSGQDLTFSIETALKDKKFYGYDAICFDKQDIENLLKEKNLESGVLDKLPESYHLTIQFHGRKKPSSEQLQSLSEIYGKPVEVKILGYANDGKNEGFLCEGHQKDGRPFHITLSISEDGKAVDTGHIFPIDKDGNIIESSNENFQMFDEPVVIQGVCLNSQDPRAKQFSLSNEDLVRRQDVGEEIQETPDIGTT